MSDREFLEEEREEVLDESQEEQTEENGYIEAEESEVNEDVEESSQSDEIVERAKKYGHLSKEEWIAQGRDPDKYKTPEEFDKTGKVIEQLYTLKKKVDQRDRELQAVIEYQKRTEERAYAQAVRDLESRLASSKDDMDMEGVAHYTKELVRLQDNEQHNQVQHRQQAQQSAQQAFIERNAHWFNDRNPDLKARAIEIDNEIKDIYPNATFDEIAKKIETRMQYDYPERVLGQQTAVSRPRPSASSVNKSSVNTNSAKRTFQSLSQDLKDTYNVYARIRASTGGELTHAEFIERLRKDGEL